MTEVLEPTVDGSVTPQPDTPEAPRRRFRPSPAMSWVVTLALAAGTWAAVASGRLFPLLTDNADEGAYLSQSEAFRAVHKDAGQNKPLYLDHPQFEGFEVRQTVERAKAAVA